MQQLTYLLLKQTLEPSCFMQYTVVFMKSSVTETITSIKSDTALENSNHYNGYHSKIKAAKTTFCSGGFSASRNFFGGFTVIAAKNSVRRLNSAPCGLPIIYLYTAQVSKYIIYHIISIIKSNLHAHCVTSGLQTRQESLADAKVSARQQCVYEGP